MSDKYCAVCLAKIENEDAPVLAMGSYGVPRLLCDDCAADLDTATRGTDYGEIAAAMDRISLKLSRANIDDKVTMNTVTELLVEAARRATEIKNGTYDFALDECVEEDYEIPEELKESEEDRALDEADKKKTERFDRVMNWIWAGVLLGFLAFIVWWLVF